MHARSQVTPATTAQANKLRRPQSYINVNDEDYIRVLTELLYSPTELSFEDLYGIIPQTCELIKEACENSNFVDDLILEEMNNDVKAILEQFTGR